MTALASIGGGAPDRARLDACGVTGRSSAVRIQRKRPRKGQPKPQTPPGTRYVGRGSFYANPFPNTRFGHARSVELHRKWLLGQLGYRKLTALGFGPSEIDALRRLRMRVLRRVHELAGLNLQCWCPATSRWCHADTLIELAALHADYERHSL